MVVRIGGAKVSAQDPATAVQHLVEEALEGIMPRLFGSLNIESAYDGRSSTLGNVGKDQLVSFLGFVGPGMRGCVTIATTRAGAEDLRPAEVLSLPDPPDAGDWVGELANQVMGRLQNQLVRHDLDLQMATPSSVTGDAIRFIPEEPDQAWYRYTFSGHPFCVRLTLEFAPSFDWEPSTETEAPASEGDALIF